MTLCDYAYNRMKHHREKSQTAELQGYIQCEVLDMLLSKRKCLVEHFYEALFNALNTRSYEHTEFSIDDEMFNVIICIQWDPTSLMKY